MTDSKPSEPNPRPRLWPAVVICAGLAVALMIIWNTGTDNHQMQVLRTLSSLVIAAVLLLIWVLFLARLAKRTRLTVLGCLVGGVAIFLGCFRFSQFSGNMVPIFEWRWAKRELPTTDSQPTAKPSELPGAHPLANLSFPQFLGPTRDCKVPGPELATDWAANPPQPLWRQPIGAAWSGFAIAGHRTVTQEQREEKEATVCYDIETGKVLWITENPGHYNTAIAGEGPRATPTIVDNHVFALGAEGILNCLDLVSGNQLWQRDLAKDAGLSTDGPSDQTGASKPRNKSKEWGFSSSPLVSGGKVIVSAGGENGKSLIAYDASTGEPVWFGGSNRAGYSSALIAPIHGEEQVLIFNQDGLAAHSPKDGSVLWAFDWNKPHPHVSMPLVLPDNKILLSLGYGNGSKLVQIKKESESYSTSELWHSRRMKAKFTNLIFHNDHVFGLDDGIFACIELERGRPTWKDGRYGHGQILLRNEHILVMAENGDVLLLEANPEKHSELTRFAALDGKTWNPPALAGEYLLFRNHREAACYKLPLAVAPTVAKQ
jgi:outer membrane protein assembly factor BamB